MKVCVECDVTDMLIQRCNSWLLFVVLSFNNFVYTLQQTHGEPVIFVFVCVCITSNATPALNLSYKLLHVISFCIASKTMLLVISIQLNPFAFLIPVFYTCCLQLKWIVAQYRDAMTFGKFEAFTCERLFLINILFVFCTAFFLQIIIIYQSS